MNRIPGLPLIVIGAILVLVPVLTHASATGQDKARVADFYMRNGNAVSLPDAMMPSGYAAYDWACLGIGAALAFVGVGQSRRMGSSKPEAWEKPEV